MDLERCPSKALVTGSSPVCGTKNEKKVARLLIFEKKIVSLQQKTERKFHKKFFDILDSWYIDIDDGSLSPAD